MNFLFSTFNLPDSSKNKKKTRDFFYPEVHIHLRPTLEIIKIDSKLLIYAGLRRVCSVLGKAMNGDGKAKLEVKKFSQQPRWRVFGVKKAGAKWSKEFREKKNKKTTLGFVFIRSFWREKENFGIHFLGFSALGNNLIIHLMNVMTQKNYSILQFEKLLA